eukprot:6690319-Lingulodinium_polyedra.AAC.1
MWRPLSRCLCSFARPAVGETPLLSTQLLWNCTMPTPDEWIASSSSTMARGPLKGQSVNVAGEAASRASSS